MPFENRILKEEERRNYVYTIDNEKKQVQFAVGTIDAENDIRLFGIGRVGDAMEPSNRYRFLYDYKGKVFIVELEYAIKDEWVISWRYIWGDKMLEQEQIEGLRQAFYTYKRRGFSWSRAIMELEEKVIVEVEFGSRR